VKTAQKLCFLFCAAVLLTIAACTSASRESLHDEKEFTVIFGSGGGFTGMANGYVIHSDGKIEKWSGLYFRRDQSAPLGTASAESLQPLRQQFAAQAFKKWSFQETGNMTTRLWCISGGDTTVVSWNGLEPGEHVPPAIRDFYRLLTDAVQAAQNF
jgi:hypothetical protein